MRLSLVLSDQISIVSHSLKRLLLLLLWHLQLTELLPEFVRSLLEHFLGHLLLWSEALEVVQNVGEDVSW